MNLSLPIKLSLKRKICPSHQWAPQTFLLPYVILFSWYKTYLLFNKMFVLFLLALSFTKKIIKITVQRVPDIVWVSYEQPRHSETKGWSQVLFCHESLSCIFFSFSAAIGNENSLFYL